MPPSLPERRAAPRRCTSSPATAATTKCSNGIDADTPVGFVPGGGAERAPARARPARRPGPRGGAPRRRPTRRRISLGPVNGRRFGFAAGIGLDAEAIRRLEARGRGEDGARAGNVAAAWEVTRLLAERRGRFEPALEILGRGRAAFALVANGDPYTYAGPLPISVAPEARFELGLDLFAPRGISPVTLPRSSPTSSWPRGTREHATSSPGTTSTGSRSSATGRCRSRPTARTSETPPRRSSRRSEGRRSSWSSGSN